MKLLLALALCCLLTGCGVVGTIVDLYDNITCASADNAMTAFYNEPFDEGGPAVGMMENHDGVPCTAGVTSGADLKCVKMGDWEADTWRAARDELRLPRVQCVACPDTVICPPWMDKAGSVWWGRPAVTTDPTWGTIKSLYR